jgi:lysophospholipase L1-like esterase
VKKSILLILFALISLIATAQDPTRFNPEVEELTNLNWNSDDDREKLLFTGSSSVRMWTDLQDYFTDFQVMNTGFGGSQFSDLIYFAEELMLKHNPDRIFIYEGDNDIAEGKSPDQVLADAKQLIQLIREKKPVVPVYIISPKPSMARWNLKASYLKLNSLLNEWASETENLNYIDVWYPMLNAEGGLNADLFLEDKLHMTQKGYDIWGEVILGALIPGPCR